MILGVYGYAEAGKTELIEKLLHKLSSKYKVATLKISREIFQSIAWIALQANIKRQMRT